MRVPMNEILCRSSVTPHLRFSRQALTLSTPSRSQGSNVDSNILYNIVSTNQEKATESCRLVTNKSVPFSREQSPSRLTEPTWKRCTTAPNYVVEIWLYLLLAVPPSDSPFHRSSEPRNPFTVARKRGMSSSAIPRSECLELGRMVSVFASKAPSKSTCA